MPGDTDQVSGGSENWRAAAAWERCVLVVLYFTLLVSLGWIFATGNAGATAAAVVCAFGIGGLSFRVSHRVAQARYDAIGEADDGPSGLLTSDVTSTGLADSGQEAGELDTSWLARANPERFRYLVVGVAGSSVLIGVVAVAFGALRGAVWLIIPAGAAVVGMFVVARATWTMTSPDAEQVSPLFIAWWRWIGKWIATLSLVASYGSVAAASYFLRSN